MADARIVRLYYVGGFVKEQVVVNSRGTAYTTPPVGEYLEVPAYTAKDLIRKNRDPQGNSVFSLDARHAEAAKRGVSRVPQLQQTAERQWTREELLAELEKLEPEHKPSGRRNRSEKAEKPEEDKSEDTPANGETVIE